ncbi:hypothetical protein GQ457_15G022520 [Hibiscus cannabinus]
MVRTPKSPLFSRCMMKKPGIPMVLLASMFLVALPIQLPIMPPRRELPPPHLHPLCVSQLTLVNYACGTVPLVPSPFFSSDTPDEGNGTESRRRGDGNRAGTRQGGERHNRRRHEHKHEQRPKEMTPEQAYCCRWLKMVDADCVCGVLARLPLFLSWPLHRYTVSVEEACIVTYSCGGRRLRSP